MCISCYTALNVARDFVSKCMSTEEKILKYIVDREPPTVSTKHYIDLSNVIEYHDIAECIKKIEAALPENNKQPAAKKMTAAVKTKSYYKQGNDIVMRLPTFLDCCECSKRFKQQKLLDRHKLEHIVSFDCAVCPKKFDDKQKLATHTILSHSKKRSVKCKYCEGVYGNQRLLEKHLLSCEAGDRPYYCHICQRKFGCNNSLQIHVLAHNSETAFVCRVCKKSFNMRTTLLQHVKIHKKDKYFSCYQCNSRFKYRSDVKKHSVVHDIK